MMKSKAIPDVDNEAADWFARWEDHGRPASAQEQSDWVAWLQSSPENVEAYFGVANLFDRLKNVDWATDVDGWLAERRAPVVALPDSSDGPEWARRLRPRLRSVSRRLGAGIAASIVALSLGLTWYVLGAVPVYSTGLGQRSSYVLADGSTMLLNTKSRARVVFTGAQRLIELDGEALFSVAHDSSRPFYVRTRDATARAVGTRFNVYAREEETRVSVIQGIVQVSAVSAGPGGVPSNAATTPSVLALAEGEEARVSVAHMSKRRVLNIAYAIAWQGDTLVFQDAPVGEVAREFNRYNALQFRIDPAFGAKNRLSGTFNAKYPQSLLLFLQSRSDVSVVRRGDLIIVGPR